MVTRKLIASHLRFTQEGIRNVCSLFWAYLSLLPYAHQVFHLIWSEPRMVVVRDLIK